jgi:hypothetical protein
MSFAVEESAFRLIGGSLKTFTRKAESGQAVVCSFCPDCGTRIYHKLQSLKGRLSLKPGTLDDTSSLRPTTELWTIRRHPWIELQSGLQSFERQPI